MRFFLGLPTDEVARRDEFGSAEAVSEMARHAEALGFEGVAVTDHPAPARRFIETGGHHALEPSVVLAVAAAATRTLKLFTNLYIVAYRNPFIAAKAIATLDSLSGGRVVLGTGAGYLEPEFRALGVDFERRNELLDEALVVMKQVWRGEPVDFEGSSGFRAEATVALPTPVAQPHPPIWIGGNSRRALRRVVEHANGWIPMNAPGRFARFTKTAALESEADLGGRIDTLRELWRAAGREGDFDVVYAPPGPAYGDPGFDAGAYAAAVSRLAALGVTGIPVILAYPGRGGLESRKQFLQRAEAFAREITPRKSRGSGGGALGTDEG